MTNNVSNIRYVLAFGLMLIVILAETHSLELLVSVAENALCIIIIASLY